MSEAAVWPALYMRHEPGFGTPEEATLAAVRFATDRGLTVDRPEAMIEQAYEGMLAIEAQDQHPRID